jgi:hypothetical protein
VALLVLAACSDVQMIGATAAEHRRVMNDLQARGTMAAVCDISIGAYWREMTAAERLFADELCGDTSDMIGALRRLEASE